MKNKHSLLSHYISYFITIHSWASFHIRVWVLPVYKLSFWYMDNKFLLITTSVIHWFYLNLWCFESLVFYGTRNGLQRRPPRKATRCLVPREPIELTAFLLTLQFEGKSLHLSSPTSLCTLVSLFLFWFLVLVSICWSFLISDHPVQTERKHVTPSVLDKIEKNRASHRNFRDSQSNLVLEPGSYAFLEKFGEL